MDYAFIYGKHALEEALKHNPLAVDRVFVDRSFDDQSLKDRIRAAGISMDGLDSKTMPRDLDPTSVHQGVVARIHAGQLIRDYDEFIKTVNVTPDTAFVILGEVQDPHNVGAIIRSAAAFGISGVIIPEHNQAPVTGTVVKVSAGTAFSIPLLSVGNVNNTIRDLKEKGFWIYGLAEEGDHPINTEKFDAPVVFVLGNESKGIREKTVEACDILLTIPMHPRCESLNVGVSAGVALAAWSNQHPKALS